MRTLIVVGAASLFVAALLLFSQRVATQVETRRTYSPGRTRPASPAPQLSLNLNGRWKDDGNNTLIDITMTILPRQLSSECCRRNETADLRASGSRCWLAVQAGAIRAGR